tara:strand:+ start:6305 stop:7210 length:906 start_codon:yes stop_codon:yes gene_type:complete
MTQVITKGFICDFAYDLAVGNGAFSDEYNVRSLVRMLEAKMLVLEQLFPLGYKKSVNFTGKPDQDSGISDSDVMSVAYILAGDCKNLFKIGGVEYANLQPNVKEAYDDLRRRYARVNKNKKGRNADLPVGSGYSPNDMIPYYYGADGEVLTRVPGDEIDLDNGNDMTPEQEAALDRWIKNEASIIDASTNGILPKRLVLSEEGAVELIIKESGGNYTYTEFNDMFIHTTSPSALTIKTDSTNLNFSLDVFKNSDATDQDMTFKIVDMTDTELFSEVITKPTDDTIVKMMFEITPDKGVIKT